MTFKKFADYRKMSSKQGQASICTCANRDLTLIYFPGQRPCAHATIARFLAKAKGLMKNISNQAGVTTSKAIPSRLTVGGARTRKTPKATA